MHTNSTPVAPQPTSRDLLAIQDALEWLSSASFYLSSHDERVAAELRVLVASSVPRASDQRLIEEVLEAVLARIAVGEG